MGCGVWGVCGVGCVVWGAGCGVWNVGCGVEGSGDLQLLVLGHFLQVQHHRVSLLSVQG